MASKPSKTGMEREVIYDTFRWKLLGDFRRKALKVMETLDGAGFKCFIYGSISRGDVSETSDIDILVLSSLPSMVEFTLEKSFGGLYERLIVQATPTSVPKVHLYIEPLLTVTIPLGSTSPREEEFYKLAGMLDLPGLKKGLRVPGMNKELLLIVPNRRGHIEKPVFGIESYVARITGVSIETVRERERVLLKRSLHGRTGVFIKYEISKNESIESAVKKLMKNPYFRKRVA